MNVHDLFAEVAEQMRTDVRKARVALPHAGLKGDSFEDIFRGFLRDYLPRSLDVSTGIIIDSAGKATRQLDVIISDAAKTPILYRSGEVRVVPIECVYAVMEVKAHLDSAELDKCFQNMLSVRQLDKLAYLRAGDIHRPVQMYGRDWDIWPSQYFLFAYDSMDLATVAQGMLERHGGRMLPEHQRIDCVCVLDKGVICNEIPGEGFNATPAPGSRLYVCTTSKALLLFYALISRYMNQACMPIFNFRPYLGQITFD